MKSPEIQAKLNQLINSNFSNDINGVNSCVNEFQNIIIEASKRSLKIRKKKVRRELSNVTNKKWFDKECRIRRHEVRKLANQKHKDPGNIDLRNAYHSTLKTYKETLEIKKNNFHQEKINELEKATENNPNLFWKILQTTNDTIENNTNTNNSPSEENWLAHFGKLHCKHRLTEEHEEITEKLEKAEEHKNQFNELDKEITDYEISRAAKKIKLKKAAYSDKINNEMIKSSIDILNKGFIKVFNIIIT